VKDYFKNLLNYRCSIGMLSWILMRISGLLLVIFLILHLCVIFYYHQRIIDFSHLLRWRNMSIIKVLEFFLILTICYHALNGVRLIFMDMGFLIKMQKPLFVTIIIISLIVAIAFVFPFPS